MSFLSALPVAASGMAAGWVIAGGLTFLLIALPLLYLIGLLLATDDDVIDRAVRDQVQYSRLKERADAYAFGKDVYGVLDGPLVLEPLAATAVAAAPGVETAPAAPRPDGRRRAEYSYNSVGSMALNRHNCS